MRIVTLVLVFLFLILIIFARDVNIVHINDFHGRLVPQVQKVYKEYSYTVAGAEYISSIIRNIRQNNENVFLFDAGDFSAGTIYSNLSQGMSVVDFYNYLGFDAVVIGNHEFDFGYEAFAKMVKGLSTNVLCANADPIFENTKPFVVLNKYGLNIAVVGLLTPETKMITMPNALGGREIVDPIESLKRYKSDILKHNPDLVVVLSHCGLKVDENVAKNVDYVDLIIGGHSHTELFEPVVVENNNKKIYIVQAGSYGKYVGHIKLNIQNRKINGFEYKVYPTINAIIVPDKDANLVIQKYVSEAHKYSSRIIGRSEVTMDKNNKDKNLNLGTFITNVLAYVSDSDIAFYNNGGIRDVLHKGEITYGQIFNILPFENSLVKFKMKGSDIIKLLNNLDNKKTKLHYNEDLENREGKWYLKGKEIREDEFYSVSTVDFLYYGGDGYTEFSSYPVIKNYGYSRELLVNYIRNNSPILGSKILVTSK
ncbi:MAG: bifunctional metallophosphatase/5'-nucleotidase [bacterium]|nr:bifunctional metallophosphatase/5'-nucleotidase [bacterium]